MIKKFFFKRLKYYFLLMLVPTISLFLISSGITSIQAEKALCNAADTNLSSVEENLNLVIYNALYQHDLMTNNPQLYLALQKLLIFSSMDYSDYTFMNSMRAILNSIANSHEYISSIYLYLDGYSDYFSSDDGICYLDKSNDISWYNTYQSLSAKQTMWFESRQFKEYTYSAPSDYITVYQRMTFQKGVIVVNIDEAQFKKILATMVTQDQENMYLLNADAEILSCYQDTSLDIPDFHTIFSTSDKKLPLHKWIHTNDGICMVTVKYLSDFNIYLVSTISIHAMLNKLLNTLYVLILMLIFNCCLILFLAYATTKKSFSQIQYVIDALQNAEHGTYPIPGEVPFDDEFGVIMTNVISVFLNTTFLNSQLKEQKYHEEATELAALQLQINPHFLFNTLQTLNMEALRQTNGTPTSVNQIIEELSDILKYSLTSPHKMVFLQEEISYLKKYVSIQIYRFGERFVMYYEIEHGLENIHVMRLILQPLIENSISHGILPLNSLGFIKLKIFMRNDRIHFTVIDSGIGLTKESLRDIKLQLEHPSGDGRSIGLSNVNRRLILHYGEESALNIMSHKGLGTCISFTIPHEEKINL